MIGTIAGDPKKRQQTRERFERALRTGETCAVCGQELNGAVYRRKVNTGVRGGEEKWEERSAVVCEDCRCDHYTEQAHFCERCIPQGWRWVYNPPWGSYRRQHWYCPDAGPDHHGPYCEECHPRTWHKAKCPGCDREMKVHWHGNMARALDEEGYRGALRVFCSQRCRSRYDHDRAGTRRTEERIEAGPIHCVECHEVLEARRSDSIYCSSACRQRAYRKRKANDGGRCLRSRDAHWKAAAGDGS